MPKYSRGERIYDSVKKNKFSVGIRPDTVGQKVVKSLKKHYEWDPDPVLSLGVGLLARPFSSEQLDQLGRLAEQLQTLVNRQNPLPAGICHAMTTLWCREIELHRSDPDRMRKAFQDLEQPDSEPYNRARSLQQSFAEKIRKRHTLSVLESQDSIVSKSGGIRKGATGDEAIWAASTAMDKKAKVSAEAALTDKSVSFPAAEAEFLEAFKDTVAFLKTHGDLYRFSFSFKTGAHTIGFCSSGGHIYLMDPNWGIAKYDTPETLNNDLASEFYGGDYPVVGGQSSYRLLKLRKLD